MEAYQAGLIDRVEALKKTEIFDKEGVLQRTDEVSKLQGMLQQAQEQLKRVGGDLQTAHRESISSRKRTEVEKFKTRLKEQELDSKAKSKLQVGRLTDAVKLEAEKLRMDTRSETQKAKEKSQEGAK
jgi:exonuclease VII large subunit